MYGAIWRVLPGNGWVKSFLSLVLVALVVAALFSWVFPWAETALPFLDASVEEPSSAALHVLSFGGLSSGGLSSGGGAP